MRVCATDDCLIEGLALPKWFHVCPVCGYETWDLDEIERAMKETPISIELVETADLNRMLGLLYSNQENWDEEEWDFVAEMHEKYGDNHDSKKNDL